MRRLTQVSKASLSELSCMLPFARTDRRFPLVDRVLNIEMSRLGYAEQTITVGVSAGVLASASEEAGVAASTSRDLPLASNVPNVSSAYQIAAIGTFQVIGGIASGTAARKFKQRFFE
jgi:hypothetical protein